MNSATLVVASGKEGPVSLTLQQIEGLTSRIEGRLIRPGEPDWADATEIWNAMAARQPAVVLQPFSAGDVAVAVSFARDNGVLLSVKGGGHNIAGTAIAEGGLTLDMSRMCDVTVDPARKLAHVGPGCRLQDVDRATQAHGLATVLGFVSETGVAGLTLGGGLGYLTRRFGWAVDNLQEVEIVTADGEIRIASRDRHADLFWGVRGAGANLGVVTRFTFRLHEVGPTVQGGLIAWPFERADEVLATYLEMTRTAPRELAAWLVLLHGPPAPFVPPQWHGRKLCALSVCYSGPPEQAADALAPIRSLDEPVFDFLREQPYVEVQSQLDGTEPRGMHHYWKTEFLSGLSGDLLSTVRDLFGASELPESEVGILHLGGALNERPEDDGAVGNRDARFVVGVKAMWEAGNPNSAAIQRWVREGWARVRPFSTGRTYINFQGTDEDENRVRGTYGANFERLAEVKTHYDPANLFRSNRNVPPREW
jgi:UDP-N-acetylenolpyruvoylglucosamine reductase